MGYYDYTPQEKMRVDMAAFFGIKLDPVGYADLAAVVIVCLVNAVGLSANAFVWFNRHYAPLKAKNIPLMTGIYMQGLCLFLGDLTLCGLVHIRGPFFGNCMLMLIWLRTLFGTYTLGGLMTIRSYTLYRVFCQNKPILGVHRFVPYIIFVAAILTIGTITSLMPKRMTMDYMAGIELCLINKDLINAILTGIWLMWGGFILMLWLLRNIRTSFNEFREVSVSLIVLIASTIFNHVLLQRIPNFPIYLAWRLSLMFIDQFTTNLIWWMIMGKTVYKCMFHYEEYLLQWKHTLLTDGLHSRYGMPALATEISALSNTLVYTQATVCEPGMGCKMVETDPSYSESTRIALDQLAALAESHKPKFADITTTTSTIGWHETVDEEAGAASDGYYYRHSVSCTRIPEVYDGDRRSESEVLSLSHTTLPSRVKPTRLRMLAQRIGPWFGADKASEEAPASVSSSERDGLVAGESAAAVGEHSQDIEDVISMRDSSSTTPALQQSTSTPGSALEAQRWKPQAAVAAAAATAATAATHSSSSSVQSPPSQHRTDYC